MGSQSGSIFRRAMEISTPAANLRLVARHEAHRRYGRDKYKPKPTPLRLCDLLPPVRLAGLRVKRVFARTPVLLPHFGRQALESQLAPPADATARRHREYSSALYPTPVWRAEYRRCC